MRTSQPVAGSRALGLIRDLLFLGLGVSAAAIGLKTLIIPSGFIDGGVTGVSLLINAETGISFSLLLVIVNIPFFILGWRSINLDFAIRMVLGIVGLSIAVEYISIHPFTDDKILASIFGGGLLGCGIGFAMRGRSWTR